MNARWITAGLFVAFADSLSAQSAAVLGRDDAIFANRLFQSGYADLAEKLCTTLIKSGKASPDDTIGIRALQLDLRLDLAQRETDMGKRIEQLKAVLAEKEDLIRQYSGSKQIEDTVFGMPDSYQKLAEAVTVAVQRETDATKIATLQREGGEMFKKAEESLLGRIESLKKDLSEMSTPDPKLEERLLFASYNLPRTSYFHALLQPKDDYAREQSLDKAIEGFNVFGLDFGDKLLAYDALRFIGLCYKEKGDNAEALKAFDDSIRLRELYEPDQKGYYQMGPAEADIVSSAVLQKVLLQTQTKDYAGAQATAKNFYDTTSAAHDTVLGLAILAAAGDAAIAAGDTKSAGDIADKLVQLDPRGSWGAKGRELQGRMLGSGGNVGAEQMLQIAQTFRSRGMAEKAMQIAQGAREAARGTDQETKIGMASLMLMGEVFKERGWQHEAALAFDEAAERYGKEESAPEAIFQAHSAYKALNKEAKRAFFQKRADDRQKTLVTKYPNHPRATVGILSEGNDLVDQKKYAEAAEFFAKVRPDSNAFLEAQYGAGDAYLRQVRELVKDPNKLGEAKTIAGQAETLIKKALDESTARAAKTIRLDERASFESLGRRSLVALAQLYLTKGIDRQQEALTLLEGAEERIASSPETQANVWSLRIDAMQELGRLDDAANMLDALAKRDAQSTALAAPAGKVARAYDERAQKLRGDKKEREADEAQKRAAQYYSLSGRALLRSTNPRFQEIEVIAKRLFALGLNANNVPEKQETFVGWNPKKNVDTSKWELAGELYDAALRQSPSYKMTITQARAAGFQGRWDRAAALLDPLFEAEPQLLDKNGLRLNRTLLNTKIELLGAYFERAVATYQLGVADKDVLKIGAARDMFAVVVGTYDTPGDRGGRNWWFAKYYHLRALYDSGKYQDAKKVFNDLERTTEGFGKEHGLEGEFQKLRDELKDK